MTLYVLNNAYWGCEGTLVLNLQIVHLHQAYIEHWAFLGFKTSDSIDSAWVSECGSWNQRENEDWFPQQQKKERRNILLNDILEIYIENHTIYNHHQLTSLLPYHPQKSPKRKRILSSFTYPHPLPNLYDVLSFVKHNRWYFNSFCP